MNNNNGNLNIENKENQNTNNLRSLETNTEKLKLNLDKISPNTEAIDNRCYTEMNNEQNSNKNLNKNEENQTLQNGGTIVSTIYDEITNIQPQKVYRERNNYSMDLDDSEEPTQQKINESYKPKVTIQGFLQTDANNIKMNARLIKEKNNLNIIQKKFNDKAKILKSEESINIGEINNTNNNKNYCESKEIENNNSNINRILLTEVDNIGVKNIQKSLLNKTNNNLNNNNVNNKITNNSIETYSKKMVNNKPKNININLNLNKKPILDDFIRINTLYNKDDSEDFSSIKKELLSNNNINTKILTTENNDSKYINNKTDLDSNNTNISKAINGLNVNNLNTNETIKTNHNKTKSVEKDLIINNSNLNKDKDKEKNKFFVTLPASNQIYKQEKIMKFINQKTISLPKSKENSKKNIREVENGKLFINNNINKNKYKIKNRYSQENVNPQYKNIYGVNMNGITNTKPNGSNDNNLANKNIGIYTHFNNFNLSNINKNMLNIGNILYVKKKRKPKSIDDTINKKNFLQLEKDNKNNITIENKNSNNNSIINNKEIYLKVNNINNYKKQFYREKIQEQKYTEEPFIESFRYKKLNNNINKLNKKGENDSNNTSNMTNRLNSNINSLYINKNSNYIIEKAKNRENNNKNMFIKDIINYTNITTNKNNRLHEHNSFEGPKNMKYRIKPNHINNSVEKNKYIISNNNSIISKYSQKNNYYKLNKKIKQYYRNIGSTKQNQPVTQYFGVNNYNKIINNYNIDDLDKITNEKINAKNKRLNYRISAKMKSNSLDLEANKSKSNTDKNSNNHFYNNNKIKNQKKSYLNTSVIKDKTPKNFITSFFKEKNKLNNAHRNNYYLNTIENNNLVNNTHKNIEENRYMTFRDSENLGSTSTRRTHVQKYLFPAHKRYNFSQEPEKKKKENDVLEIFTVYGKGNSFIFNNLNKNNLAFKKEKKKINNINNKEQNINNNGYLSKNIYSKTPFEKIKENVEKITGNKIDLKNKNSLIFECKYKEGNNIIYFRLNISKNHKDFFIISPILIKGNQSIYKTILEKIKNKLM